MTALYLYDDAVARRFAPFALTRPVSELRAGAMLIRRRWEYGLSMVADGAIVAPHLQSFEEQGAPQPVTGDIPAGAIVANSRCVVALGGIPPDASVWTCDGRIAAVRLARTLAPALMEGGARTLDSLADPDAARVEIAGWWLDEPWHLIRDLATHLSFDIIELGRHVGESTPDRAIVIGVKPLFVDPDSIVEPQVCFDVTAGPILVGRGATVQAFTRLVGPCFIGDESWVAGDRIAATSIGEMCRVHGEVSTSIFVGHANKSHDGFVGHSVLGRWTNLGAGTTTSNLKNTYGTVALWTPDGIRDTGLVNLGALIGDHAKTGIGVRLTTGTVIGAGANVVGTTMPPKYVPPFSWGEAPRFDDYELEKFLGVAERVMARRSVALGERGRQHLTLAYHGRRA
ncbi:MAG: putative sugar nucleotidyl transferase [Gemmatimonadaceae bacterium]